MLGLLLRTIRNGPIVSMVPASTVSTLRKCSTATSGLKSSLSPSDGSRRSIDPGTFDRKHAQLRCDAAMGGEAADLAAGSEHAMTWHDDWERVLPERLADRARRAGRAKAGGNLAVRQCRAWRDAARDLVDAAMKRRHLVHVERSGREIARVAVEQRGNAIEGPPDFNRRHALARRREPLQHPCPRLLLVCLRELQAGDAAVTPSDAASPDRRVEKCETVGRHAIASAAAPGRREYSR